MKAMILKKLCDLNRERNPLDRVEVPIQSPGNRELLVKVTRCGVCHTELDEIEGRTPPPYFPVIPGHQVIGRVAENGPGASRFKEGDRIGIAWIHSACGTCPACRAGTENLCPNFKATGRDADGGYAEYTVVSEDFAYRIPEVFSDTEAAPLLCAGAIGYRSLRLSRIEDGGSLGLAGFGASAHLVLGMVRYRFPRSRVFVFARSDGERRFAVELGAAWSGDISEKPPEKLNAVIDSTPAWKPVVESLKHLVPGGRLVINAIRKENADRESLSSIEYPTHLWQEKEIKSVANVTRADVEEFLQLAARMPMKPHVQEYPLEEANKALLELKERKIRGAKVLKITEE